MSQCAPGPGPPPAASKLLLEVPLKSGGFALCRNGRGSGGCGQRGTVGQVVWALGRGGYCRQVPGAEPSACVRAGRGPI